MDSMVGVGKEPTMSVLEVPMVVRRASCGTCGVGSVASGDVV